MERGILFRLLQRSAKLGFVTCNVDHVYPQQALGLQDVFTAFLILSFGYLFSLAAFAFEMILMKINLYHCKLS